MKRADVNDEDKLTLPTMTVYSRGFKGPCGFVVHGSPAAIQKPLRRKAAKPVRRKRKVSA